MTVRSRNRQFVLLTGVLVTTSLLAACGGGADDESASTSTPPAAVSTPPADQSAEPTIEPTSEPTTDEPSADATSAAPTGDAASPAPTTTSDLPPIGIPGGIPGAEPLSEVTRQALTAVAVAVGEAGGPAYELTSTSDGWTVLLAVWDGGREVLLSPDGVTSEGQEPVEVDPRVSIALDEMIVRLEEAAELAVASHPGDVRGVRMDTSGEVLGWIVTVESSGSSRDVVVDGVTGQVVGR